MVITFTAVLIGLLAVLRPLQKNSFYILHSALVILSAYYIETHYFKCTPFAPKTFMMFVVFQLIFIIIPQNKGSINETNSKAIRISSA